MTCPKPQMNDFSRSSVLRERSLAGGRPFGGTDSRVGTSQTTRSTVTALAILTIHEGIEVECFVSDCVLSQLGRPQRTSSSRQPCGARPLSSLVVSYTCKPAAVDPATVVSPYSAKRNTTVRMISYFCLMPQGFCHPLRRCWVAVRRGKSVPRGDTVQLP